MVSTFVNHIYSFTVRFRDFAGTRGDETPGDLDWMAGAKHRSHSLFARRPIGFGLRERPDSAPLGKAQRSLPGRSGCDLPGIGGILLADAGATQRRADTVRAIAPPGKRGGAGRSEGAVVDIAQRRHAF